MITIDQLLDAVAGHEPESAFKIQGRAHEVGAIIYEWALGNLSNGDIATLLNIDITDPEVGTAKTFLLAASQADVIAIEKAFILASAGVAGYDKALLRGRVGL